MFEPFGGIRSAFTAAKEGKPVDSQIEMASSEGLFTSDPDYAPPCVGDIELVFIAFDILFVDEEVRLSAHLGRAIQTCTIASKTLHAFGCANGLDWCGLAPASTHHKRTQLSDQYASTGTRTACLLRLWSLQTCLEGP